MTIFTEIAPIITQINKATLLHERLGRERVLALVLQSEGYATLETGFPFKSKKIGLGSYKKESMTQCITRLEHITFTYEPLHIPGIVRTLATIQPVELCRKKQYTRMANKITAAGCGQYGSLFSFFEKLANYGKERKSSRQQQITTKGYFGQASTLLFELLLQDVGVDPHISWAEITYFQSKTTVE